MSEAKAKINNFIVKKSNDLTIARYSMTVNEQRLLLACISQIPVDVPLSCEFEFVLTMEQAQELFYSAKGKHNIHRDMREAVAALWERYVKIPLSNGGVLQTRFVSSIVWEADRHTVKVNFAPKILPYLSMLKGNFTRYRLNNVVQLTSFYAVRIYELIVRWSENGKHSSEEIEIEELKKILDIEEKYESFSQFRGKVIEIAVSQINANTDFQVEYEFKKSGRAFKWIVFSWKRDDEAVKAEQEVQTKRKILTEHNQNAKAKREYIAQVESEKLQKTQALQARAAAEQEREAQERAVREKNAEKAVALWQTLSDAERGQVREVALSKVYPVWQNSLLAAFESENLKELTGRFYTQFIEALEETKPVVADHETAAPQQEHHDNVRDTTPAPADDVVGDIELEGWKMYQQGTISETELLLLLTREDAIRMFKEGKVSKAEFLELLDKLK